LEDVRCTGAAIATDIDPEVAVEGARKLESVPGRLERAAALNNGATVYVDFAHTPDALQNVLRNLRPHVRAGAKLHVLFGCGGDRDTSKRPIMGRIARELADVVLVTDDNPRTESAVEIRKSILAAAPGAHDSGERYDAIHTALSGLREGDVLLVAGKGHEDYQILPLRDNAGQPVIGNDGKIQTQKIPFSDAQVVREHALSLRLLPREEGVLAAA
jgi:UDP-N-acetylmuramoyl-L-alanyl-D-glutamate--2,6-diaminopimelate ligase